MSLDIIMEQEFVWYIVIKGDISLEAGFAILKNLFDYLANENARYIIILMGKANATQQMSMNSYKFWLLSRTPENEKLTKSFVV
jgi:hypothetical protein